MIHEVYLNKRSASYIVTEIRPMLSDRRLRVVYKPVEERYCEATNTYCDRLIVNAAGELENVLVGVHAVSASVISPDWNVLYGMVVGSYTFSEADDGKTIHVYVPTSLEFQNLDPDQRSAYIEAYMKALNVIGVEAMSDEEITLDDLETTEVRFDEIGL
jgi:hypothetical protein